MWNRVELKMRGKQAFQYNYWPCVGAAFIMSVISMVFNSGGAGRSTQTLRQTTYYHDSTDLCLRLERYSELSQSRWRCLARC